MKSTFQFIEPLEPRVAPAILVNGGNLLGGNGNPDTGQTSAGANTVTLVKVLSGEALVFFDNGTITGISIGKHTKLDVTGNIGDIVANLGPNGRLTDSDNDPSNGEDGGILLATKFTGLTTHPLSDALGSVGRIITGGAVANINVAGALGGIYTGDGIFKTNTTGAVDVDTGAVDFNSIHPGLDHTFHLLGSLAQSSAVPSISNVSVGVADQLQLFAGDGRANANGPGRDGGSISNVNVIKSDASDLNTPAIHLHAGDGAAGATSGGAGGAITKFTDLASISYVKLQTGDGGSGGVQGGAGGSFTSSKINSDATRYEILVGAGGTGATGGAGGSVQKVTFSDTVSGGVSLLATGDFTGDGVNDVLLVNTVTGNATLSAGTASNPNGTQAPFRVVLHPATDASGAATLSPYIAAVGSVPTDVLATDVNGDGNLDFVVSYGSSNSLGVFLNQGGGVFASSIVALPVSPTRIAAGTFTNSGHLDLAVLAAGSVPGGTGTLSSQIYVAEGDGAGNFGTISAPDTFSGVATDFVSGQLDNANGADLVVGFQSGAVDTFLANPAAAATPFSLASTLKVFNGPVGNLDISNSSLLAFTVNTHANDIVVAPAAQPTVTPLVQLLNVTASGALTSGVGFNPGTAPLAAHFIGSTNDIGVVTANDISIFKPVENSYASVTSLTSDGALTDFVANVSGNDFQIVAAGASASRFFASSGKLDAVSGVGTLLPFDIPGQPSVTVIQAGHGGAGSTGDGGNGGSIDHFKYSQTVGGGVAQAGARFNITLATGDGGDTQGGSGGKGGAMSRTALTLDPADLTGQQDSTTLAVLSTGQGGAGASGGHGGEMTNITSTSIFDQADAGGVIPNSVAVQLLAGAGGVGTAGAGGNGGDITLRDKPALNGVSFFDPVSSTPFAAGLTVQGGNGGEGATTGGNGGSLTNIKTQNALASTVAVASNELASAVITSGQGGAGHSGNGGRGGAITGLSSDVASQSLTYRNAMGAQVTLHLGGTLVVHSGAGGLSTNGTGGAGGSVVKSTVASVDGDSFRGDDLSYYVDPNIDPYRNVGVLVTAGAGGDGTAGGGKGGGIKQLDINSPSAPDVYAAILLGGDGGAATAAGAGGVGGSIHGVTQTKDVNSSLSLLEAGDGGASVAGAGGNGGSVKKVDTVGFIGLPATALATLGVFNDAVSSPLISSLFDGTTAIAQGIFAGRGNDGGIAGSVINVVARQIAAIGASVDANGLFGVATAVSNIKADLIGYEVVRDNVFTSTNPGSSPSQAAPVDGFILGGSVSDIATTDDARTAGFTFGG